MDTAPTVSTPHDHLVSEPLLGDVHPPSVSFMSYRAVCQPPFLADMVFTITLTEHVPWGHHAVHEQAPEPVVVHSAPMEGSPKTALPAHGTSK